MKINNISMNNISNLYKVKTSKVDEEKKQKGENDSIEISSAGKKISNYFKGEVLIPDDKRALEIKSLIEKGTYKIDTEDIARSIILNLRNKEM